jgi:hypothetical protein
MSSRAEARPAKRDVSGNRNPRLEDLILALLGGVIVAVIYNGLELLGLGPAARNMWTAAVLLAPSPWTPWPAAGPPPSRARPFGHL